MSRLLVWIVALLLLALGGGYKAVPVTGASPAVFPIYVSCGQLPAKDSAGEPAIYRTKVEITLLRTTGENGEILVSPDVVAGEINPGETVILECGDLLVEGESLFGTVNVQVYPDSQFRIRVTYYVD